MVIRERSGQRCWLAKITRGTTINELLADAIIRDMHYDAASKELVATVELIDALRDAGMTVVGGEGREYLEFQA
jgi:hypothetical protein